MKLMEVFAALAPASGGGVAIAESYPGLDYQDPDINLPATGGGSTFYRRLTQLPSDLPPTTHDRMQQIALSLYDRNPLAKRCLELIKDFVVGEGIVPSAKAEDVQEAISRFWDDGQNAMAARMHTFALELGLWGEQAFAAFVNETSGHVRLVSIDPRSIKAAIPDPSNPDLPLAICLLAETGIDARYLKVIRENGDGLLVGAASGERIRVGDQEYGYWDPASSSDTEIANGTRLVGCFFWTINTVQGATRGRSDLLSIADFLDLYDRLIFDEAERMSFLRAFVWDVTLKGATAAEIAARAANEPPPKPGSVRLHNESEEWKAIAADLKAQDGATTADLILSLIATGAGLPKQWLNGIMDVNRATALSMDEPSLKRLRARQQVVIGAVERMVRFALDQAELAGALKPADEGRHPFAVDVPEMSSRDLEKASRALFSAIQALGMADAAAWIDSETARQVVALLLGQLGVNVDLADLKERLEQERAAQADADEYEVPRFFGVGSRPGRDEVTKAMGQPSGGADGDGAGINGAAPPIAVPDAQAWANVLDKVAGALVELGNAGVIDGEFAQDVVGRLFAMAGVEVDLDAMRDRLEAEEEDESEEEGEADEAEILADLPIEDEATLEALREAFEEDKHPRGPGGKFASKGAPTDEYSPASSQLRAQIDKILGGGKKGRGGKAKTAKPKGKAAGKGKGRAAKPKSLSKGELGQRLRQLKAGASVTITLANGSVVKGTVERSAGGVALVKTDKGTVALHGSLRNVAKIEG